jgi:hypothetical protein
MPKDSRKMVANLLVRLFGSAPGLAVALGGVMSIGCGLKGSCGGVSEPKQMAFGWP